MRLQNYIVRKFEMCLSQQCCHDAIQYYDITTNGNLKIGLEIVHTWGGIGSNFLSFSSIKYNSSVELRNSVVPSS